MRSYRAQHNLCAVSASAAETAINTAQALDTTLLIGLDNAPNLEPKRESNADELTGKEEPDAIYDLGATSGMSMNFPKAQAQHFAFLLAYALGAASSAAAGDGYLHSLTPIAGDLDADRSLPGFTLGFRYGETVFKRRFESLFVDQFTARFQSDQWVQCSAEIKGTGKYTDNVIEEEIAADDDVTTLTLAHRSVQGATAAERLASVHQVRVELATGVWTEVDYTAVSDATPAAITIVAPGESSAEKTYKVLYVPAEDEISEDITALDTATTLTLAANAVAGGSSAPARLASVRRVVVELTAGVWTEVTYSAVSADTPAAISITAPGVAAESFTYRVIYTPAVAPWCSAFPARVTETPLRVAEMTLKVGGAWNGSTFLGGRELTSELRSLEWTLQNNLAIEFVPGSGDAYAGRCWRDGRTQVLKLEREMREFILQNLMGQNETLAVHILCEGALYDATHKYQVEIVFPKVGVLRAPVSAQGKRLAEAGDLQVLEHDTYGSVAVYVQNLVAAYAA